MALVGKIQTLFSDKDKTSPIFPRTVVSAIVDEDGNNFFKSLNGNIIYLDEAAEESSAEIINANTLNGHTADYFASKTEIEVVQSMVNIAQSTTNDVKSMTETAQSTANTAQSTANNAKSMAETAQSTANTNKTALGGLKFQKITQANYNALSTKDSSTLYIIVG